MTDWNGQPAIGVILAKLVNLAARVERVRMEKQRQQLARVIALTRQGEKR